MTQPTTTALRALVLALLLSPAAAQAHGIESSLTRLESLTDSLVLESRFSNGEPTSDAVVRLVGPDGESREIGRTNAQGQLSFALPKQANGEWELQVDGGPGHRDYLEMPVQQGQAQLDQISQHSHGSTSMGWLGALGATAMLLGVLRIRRHR
jgi:nickel transport protein